MEKEKAMQLVNTYKMILMNEDTDCGHEILCTNIAIKCATVTANEMIKHNVVFWNNVIKELNKM